MVENAEQGVLALYTPGQLLTEARDNKQLQQLDVANALHLSPDIIAAIENDEFEKITSSTYVRGYLRSYAKLVDVDEDSLIQLYNEGLQHAHDPEIIPKVSQKSQISSSDKPVKIVTYLISFMLVLLLLVWWQSKYLVNDPAAEIGESSEENSKVVDNSTVLPEKVAPAFDYEFAVIHHSEQPEAAIPYTGQPEQDTDEPIETTVSDASASASELTGDLKLTIDEESWVEVYNVNDRRLYQKLAQPGSIVNITGLLPLSVLIGNARGVKLEFNGEVFDIQPFTRANVARLLLGGADDAAALQPSPVSTE